MSHFSFSKEAASIEQFETLTHSLLTRPDDTAVILLGRFNTQTYQTHGCAGFDHWHNTSLGSMTFPVGVPNPSFSRTTFATRPLSLNTSQTPSSQTQQAIKFSATYLLNTYRLERGRWTRDRCCTASHTGQRSCRFGNLFGRVGQQQGMPLNKK